MSKAYIFYNPLAGNGRCKEDVSMLECVLPDEIVYCDMTKSETYERDLFSLEPGDYLILCGGDGTLNRFVNLMGDMELHHEICIHRRAGPAARLSTDLSRCYRRWCRTPIQEGLACTYYVWSLLWWWHHADPKSAQRRYYPKAVCDGCSRHKQASCTGSLSVHF